MLSDLQDAVLREVQAAAKKQDVPRGAYTEKGPLNSSMLG